MKKTAAPQRSSKTSSSTIAFQISELIGSAQRSNWQTRADIAAVAVQDRETLRHVNQLADAYSNAMREATSRLDLLQQSSADAKAVTGVLADLASAQTAKEAAGIALSSVRSAFGWAYGSYWAIDYKANALRFSLESGLVSESFRQVTLEASFREGQGLSGRAWRSKDLIFVPDLGDLHDCIRAPAARSAGVKSGICFPVVVKGQVVGTLDFFSTEKLSPSQERLETLRTVGRLVSDAIERIEVSHASQEAAANVAAVNQVLTTVAKASTEAEVTRLALEAVRNAFGWVYGSYWVVDKQSNVLRYSNESGSVNREFSDVTAKASFREGEGLNGRAWKARDLVFVEDLADVQDCCRREPAQRAGVKSGICFPIVAADKVTGTMDFFTLESIEISEGRLKTLRNVGQLVSAAICRVREASEAAADTRAVNQVLESVGRADKAVDAAKAALDAVCDAFGLVYGSYWTVDKTINALRFSVESGTVNEEFRRVTRETVFQEGQGFCGKAWKSKQLMFVPDLGAMTDCARREPAQRADIKSGICFPIFVAGEIIGTMDFFAQETLELSETRMAALRNVGMLVSGALERVAAVERIRKQANYQSREVTRLIGNLQKVAQGDLSSLDIFIEDTDDDLTAVANNFAKINAGINATVEAIRSLVRDGKTLADSARAGDLSKRADLSIHQGDFKDVVKGLNETLDAVVGPLNVSANYVDRISKGQSPAPIQEAYQGDFNIIKQNLNVLIEAMNTVTEAAEAIAEGDLTVEITPRSDNDKLMIAIAGMVAGLTRTVTDIKTAASEVSTGSMSLSLAVTQLSRAQVRRLLPPRKLPLLWSRWPPIFVKLLTMQIRLRRSQCSRRATRGTAGSV